MSLGAVIYKGRDVRGDVISGWRVLGCGSCFETRPSLVSPDWTCESCRRRRSRNGACPDCGKALYQTRPCDHVTHGGEA